MPRWSCRYARAKKKSGSIVFFPFPSSPPWLALLLTITDRCRGPALSLRAAQLIPSYSHEIYPMDFPLHRKACHRCSRHGLRVSFPFQANITLSACSYTAALCNAHVFIYILNKTSTHISFLRLSTRSLIYYQYYHYRAFIHAD